MATLGEPGCIFRNPSVDVVIFNADLGSASFPGIFVYVLSQYQSHICMKGQLYLRPFACSTIFTLLLTSISSVDYVSIT